MKNLVTQIRSFLCLAMIYVVIAFVFAASGTVNVVAGIVIMIAGAVIFAGLAMVSAMKLTQLHNKEKEDRIKKPEEEVELLKNKLG